MDATRASMVPARASILYCSFHPGVAFWSIGPANTKVGVAKHIAGNVDHALGARARIGLSRRWPATRFVF
jgi:hypothetical protein